MDKNLLPEYFKSYRFLIHFSRAIDIISDLWEPEKINFKFHRNQEKTGKIILRKISIFVTEFETFTGFHRNQEKTGKIILRKISIFVTEFETFKVCFLGLPQEPFFRVISYNLLHI